MIFTGGLVAVGFFQVLLLFCTLGATTKAAQAASTNAQVACDTLHLDQRPWLVPTGGAVVDYYNDLPPVVRMRIDFKNTGRTPARNLEIVVSACTSPWEDPLPASVEYAPGQTITKVGSVGPCIIHRHWMTLSFDEPEYSAMISERSLRLHVCGVIKYRDQQPPRSRATGAPDRASHETKFCIVWLAEKRFVIEGPYNECT